MITDGERERLWLSQFKSGDEQALARKLLSSFMLVDYSTLSNRLVREIRSYGKRETIGVFIEREIAHRWTVSRYSAPRWSMKPARRQMEFRFFSKRFLAPVRMYKEEAIKIARGVPPKLRAIGAALPIVQPKRLDQQAIGSEGVLATIASTAAKTQGNVLVHPSANVIRGKKIRHLVVLTDFIGSGTRLNTVLDSLWRVRSVRSWCSGGLLRISVLAYSGTTNGIDLVEKHRCKPTVRALVSCPTINTSFGGAAMAAIRELCMQHAPTGSLPLGFKETGALIAFEHSCPNNVPAIFTETSKSRRRPWHPLFPAKSTTEVFGQVGLLSRRDRERLALEALDLAPISERSAFRRATEEEREMILLLGAVHRGRRAADEIATTTLLGLPEIAAAIAKASADGYLGSELRLSAAGLSLLRRLNRMQRQGRPLPDKPLYYPKSLRDPV
ncbi:phosphoribosyltransferase-like protein [Variovorax sp. 22077]|uniref:phosphoribosyltransferase-like protein n=1 Tax=Variovorax sp. 22077 TaxID=3453867 RepID=UPI003F826D09